MIGRRSGGEERDEKAEALAENWRRLCEDSNEFLTQLETDRTIQEEMAKLATEIEPMVSRLLDWLKKLEGRLEVSSTSDLTHAASAVASVLSTLTAERPRIDAVEAALATLLEGGHTVPRINEWRRAVAARWKEVEDRAVARENSIKEEEQRQRVREAAMHEMSEFVEKKRLQLDEASHASPPSTLAEAEQRVNEHAEFERELREKQAEVDELMNRRRSDGEERDQKAEALAENWRRLCEDSNEFVTQLETDKKIQEEMAKLATEIEPMVRGLLDWLKELEGRLEVSSSSDLTHAASAVASVLSTLAAERPRIDAVEAALATLLKGGHADTVPRINEWQRAVAARWKELEDRAVARENSIKEEEQRQRVREAAMHEMNEFVEKKRMQLDEATQASPPSTLAEAEQRVDEHTEFERELREKQAELDELTNGTRSGEERDEKADALAENWRRLCQDSNECATKLETNRKIQEEVVKLATEIEPMVHGLLDWLKKVESRLEVSSSSDLTHAASSVASVLSSLAAERPRIDAVEAALATLLEGGHTVPRVNDWQKEVAARWKEVEDRALAKENSIKEEELRQQVREAAMHEMNEFVEKMRLQLDEASQASPPSAVAEAEQRVNEHAEFERELREKQDEVDELMKLRRSDGEERDEKADALAENWRRLCEDSNECATKLETCRKMLAGMTTLEGWTYEEWRNRYVEWSKNDSKSIIDLFRRLDQSSTGSVPREAFIEAVLASNFPTFRLEMDHVADEFDQGDGTINARQFIDSLKIVQEMQAILSDSDEQQQREILSALEAIQRMVRGLLDWLKEMEGRLDVAVSSDLTHAASAVASVLSTLAAERPRIDAVEAALATLLKGGHADTVPRINEWQRAVVARWKEVEDRAVALDKSIKEEEQRQRVREAAMHEMNEFVEKKRLELDEASMAAPAATLAEAEQRVSEHAEFERELREQQADIDALARGGWRAGEERDRETEALDENWRNLWEDSIGRATQLETDRKMQEEMAKLEGWTFDEWRVRYVEWNDNAKGRVNDMFRRLDQSSTGSVPREAFVEAVLASNFPTFRMEMARVADKFDKGDGMINARQFINSLKIVQPSSPRTPEEQKKAIAKEMTRRKEQCCCPHKFRIDHEEETPSKAHPKSDGSVLQTYKFGDQQIRRMVRILHTTVMVRVGGGWEPLDEFLDKHDPCKAKDRTNTAIYQMYDDVRPAHASDKMYSFTKSPPAASTSTPLRARGDYDSPSSSDYGASPAPSLRARNKSLDDVLSVLSPPFTPVGTRGPARGIREKTERSVPMFGENRFAKERAASLELLDSPHPSSSRASSVVSSVDRPSKLQSGKARKDQSLNSFSAWK